MDINKYQLINTDKLERALNGTPMPDSSRKGGVGKGAYFESGKWKRNGEELEEEAAKALEVAVLAEYDKLGGFIKCGDDVVQNGSFYNYKARAPHVNPQVSFVYKINGKTIIVPEGAETPGIVKAAKIMAADEKADTDDEDAAPAPAPKRKRAK